jgi:uncharacterized protein YqgC (DUF456 family)
MSYRAKRERVSGVPAHSQSSALVVCMIAGAAAGAVIGFFTVVGVLGAVIGAIVGAVVGLGLGELVLLQQKRQEAKDARLDREIGVIGGELGAPPL